MTEPEAKTSALVLAAAWVVVGIPLAWGVYQTAIKALPLFREPSAAREKARPLGTTMQIFTGRSGGTSRAFATINSRLLAEAPTTMMSSPTAP